MPRALTLPQKYCLVLALACLAPAVLRAQAGLGTTVTVLPDPRGAAMSTSVGINAAYHPSQVLVRFRNGGPRPFLPGSGPARSFPRDANLFVVPNPPGLSVAEVVARYRGNPNVLYAEPDYIVQAVDTLPTDPMWSQQWDMAKIAAPAAWDSQTNAGDVVVAVIDTGINFTHPDLQANIWTNPADGTNHGFTCMNGVVTGGSGGGVDDHGHGTHVAGTIGAAANNGEGIAGLNWQVKMMALKFLNSGGSGQISDAVLCLQHAATLMGPPQNINIRLTSNSWGGGGFSQALKDAFALVEASGGVHACAAGNNGQNADTAPMYPAAYDNRGIVSVLATDQNDVGAGFTNYGLESVDIAAPGVNTLSTVPTAGCSLCDPSGYRLLSGTSMATPHVSGVLAAMLHKNPALTAAQARDVILDPASYDPVSDARAKSTSTGGRLNFAKVLSNPKLMSPGPLNKFPTLTMGPDVTVPSGGQVSLSATASDDDGDALRMSWGKSVSTGSQWLMGWMLNSIFPNPSLPATFTAPQVAPTAVVPYDAAATDNRGGGAHGRNYVTVLPSPSAGQKPAGNLQASPTDAAVGGTVRITFSPADPEAKPVAWDVRASGHGGSSAICCYTGAWADLTFGTAGAYRIRAQVIDQELNVSDNNQSVVVRIGGATGTPPTAAATVSPLSGPAPLTVNINMSGSAATGGGTIQNYFFICNGGGFTPGSTSPTGTCTYTTPGVYWLMLEVLDSNGNVDLISAYVSVTPASGGGGGDTTPPTVGITAPAEGAPVAGILNITADASDNPGGSGVQKVDFYLDTPSGTPIGTDSTAPYGISWDAGTTTAGGHTLYAVATDQATNSATSAVRNITVNAPTPPAVTITNPTGATVSKRSTVNISATAAPGTYGAATRFDFLVGSTVLCSGSAASCSWKVPAAAGKSYTIQVKAYDSKNNFGTASRTVKAN